MDGKSPDVAFVNGDVYTVDAARSWAHAVAVTGGRISAVGTEDQIRDLVGPGTEIVDLGGGMLLPGFQDAGTLSGGEKTKLALAQLVAGRKNLLLLDEPTNNLDPPSRTAIAEALADWPGSMILVSHDVEFVDALAPQKVLLMPDGTLDYWSADLLELVELA